MRVKRDKRSAARRARSRRAVFFSDTGRADWRVVAVRSWPSARSRDLLSGQRTRESARPRRAAGRRSRSRARFISGVATEKPPSPPCLLFVHSLSPLSLYLSAWPTICFTRRIDVGLLPPPNGIRAFKATPNSLSPSLSRSLALSLAVSNVPLSAFSVAVSCGPSSFCCAFV